MSRPMLKTSPADKLKELQCSYYSEMLKEGRALSNRSYERGSAFSEANEITAFENRKRKADSSIQFDKILKISKNPDEKLN